MKALIKVGDRYGKLVVINCNPNPDRQVLCLCDCGTVKPFLRHNLRSGSSESCGCVTAARIAERNRGRTWEGIAEQVDPEVVPGARFGMLTATTEPYSNPDRKRRGLVALVDCDCGGENSTGIVARARDLLSGHKRSCGCLRRDGARTVMAS